MAKAKALTAAEAQRDLKTLANSDLAAHAQGFFKTGPGQYGAGDKFLGIRVPAVRNVAKQYRQLPHTEVVALLASPWHEARLLALLIWVLQFAKADETEQKAIYDLYLANTARINNWDLVDTSAPAIVGGYLMARKRQPLHKLVKSPDLWERRISIVATHYFIRQGDVEETLLLAEKLLGDKHDLIHKATGWMLREVGKQHEPALHGFLALHAPRLPRTMLRYAIERFAPDVRQRYMQR